MYVCKDCKSHRIKTRSNKSFGKPTSSAVNCKDCGSTNIANLKANDRFFRRRRWNIIKS